MHLMWLVLVLIGAVISKRIDGSLLGCYNVSSRDTNNSICDVANIELSLVPNSDAGRYLARLLAPENSCWVQAVDVNLYQFPSVNESLCTSQMDPNTDFIKHSSQKLSCPDGSFMSSDSTMNSNNLPKVNLIYDLEMVYGGCYRLLFTVVQPKPSKSVTKKGFFWIGNHHTKDEFLKAVENNIYMSDVLSSVDPVMTLLYQYKVQGNYQMQLREGETVKDIKHLCTLTYVGEGSRISCKMPNNTAPGNYTIRYLANTGWCNSDVFKCDVRLKFTIVPPAAPHKVTAKAYLTTALIIAGSSVASMAALSAVYWHYRRRRVSGRWDRTLLGTGKSKPPCPVVSAHAPDELQAIVLVYARDCQPFMEAMRLLRALLQEHHGVKVYDIFDMDLFHAEIAASPHEWAVNALRAPGVRVLVVKTPCGELLYETMMIESSRGLQLCEEALPSRVQYRVPRYTDTLLLLLFRLVKDDAVLPGSYVKISNFSGENQLPEVNPYKRYELPAGIELLLSDLRGSAQPPPPPPPPRSAAAAAELRGALARLRDHVSARPDYVIDDLLQVLD